MPRLRIIPNSRIGGLLCLVIFCGNQLSFPVNGKFSFCALGGFARSEYEFGQHTLFGKSAGLTDEEIKRITEGPKVPAWDPFDATLLQAVDELHADAFITDATWNALAKRYNKQQLMDVVATVGHYNLVSMFLNSFGVQLDEGVPGFPKGKDK